MTIKDEQTKYIYSELVEHAIKNVIIEFLKNAIHDFKNVNNIIKKIEQIMQVVLIWVILLKKLKGLINN